MQPKTFLLPWYLQRGNIYYCICECTVDVNCDADCLLSDEFQNKVTKMSMKRHFL